MANKALVAIVQVDAVLGDIDANIKTIQAEMTQAWEQGVDILCFPEMSVCGYQLEDKAFDFGFVERVEKAIEDLAKRVAAEKTVLVGGVKLADQTRVGVKEGGGRSNMPIAYNSMYLLSDGKVCGVWNKQVLPNYDVFDEKRHFVEGQGMGPIKVGGIKIGVLVCEDCWYPDVAEMLGESGADLIVICNASPYERDKPMYRLQAVLECVVRSGVGCIYLNMVGGQDELVFDGGSFVVEKGGNVVGRLPYFEKARATMLWQEDNDGLVYRCSNFMLECQDKAGALTKRQGYIEKEEGMYGACVQGLRSFVEKNGFRGVLLGLSGGVDSALTCAMAVDALGRDKVRAFRLPSKFTSDASMRLAEEMRKNLGFELLDRPIDDITKVVTREMQWEDGDRDKAVALAKENLQARVRGLLLMAESNASGRLLLTTGNKSELAVGYATMYGDMCGGYSLLKDMYKGDVYGLSIWRNQHHRAGYKGLKGEVIPQEIIDRAPSAELREGQKDADTLPPYEVLDEILRGLIEDGLQEEDLITAGHDKKVVREVRDLLRKSEYKRYQSPPGVKLSKKSFGKGWRYPITDRST